MTTEHGASDESVAATLLRLHRLPVDDEELAALQQNFPMLRAAIERLYAPAFTADVELHPSWVYSPQAF